MTSDFPYSSVAFTMLRSPFALLPGVLDKRRGSPSARGAALRTMFDALRPPLEIIMQPSLHAVNASLTLALVLLSFAPIASAEPKDDVAAAASAWARALGEDDPDKVLPLYSQDAVLWGTLSPTVRSDPASLRDYFVTAFKVLPSLKVAFGDQLIRVYGGTAVNTGYYTFSYVQNREMKTLPARYSFTYVKNGDRWLIVDHHSSAMPSAPR